MSANDVAMCLLILVLVLVIYYTGTSAHNSARQAGEQDHVKKVLEDIEKTERKPSLSTFYDLTDDEKVQYIVDNYFRDPEETNNAQDNQTKADDAYIAQLPLNDSSCGDSFGDCAKWAANNDCLINPEFMLYACPGSCNACSLNEDEKYRLVQIYNRRKPPNCATAGRGHPPYLYPDRNHYLRMFDIYFNEAQLI